MALEVRHRIHRGFEVKTSSSFTHQQSQQQLQQQQQQQQQPPPHGAAAASKADTVQSSDAAPQHRAIPSQVRSARPSASTPFSPAAHDREPNGFHDWHPLGHSASGPAGAAAASAPAGRGIWLPDSERSDVGVRGLVSMCAAARSMAAVDSPTVLKQHRVEVRSADLSRPKLVL